MTGNSAVQSHISNGPLCDVVQLEAMEAANVDLDDNNTRLEGTVTQLQVCNQEVYMSNTAAIGSLSVADRKFADLHR